MPYNDFPSNEILFAKIKKPGILLKYHRILETRSECISFFGEDYLKRRLVKKNLRNLFINGYRLCEGVYQKHLGTDDADEIEIETGGPLVRNKDEGFCLLEFLVNVDVLKKARGLDNFYDPTDMEEIATRLKSDGPVADRALYEAQVAVFALEVGYKTAFIPRAKGDNVRTPDIQIEANNLSAFIECKRKDRFVRRETHFSPVWLETDRRIAALLLGSGRNIGVSIVASGQLEERMAEPAYEAVKFLLTQDLSQSPVRRDKRHGFAVGAYLRDSLSKHSSVPNALFPSIGFTATAYNHQFASSNAQNTLAVVLDHEKVVQHAIVQKYVFDSHKIRSIIESFTEGKGQFQSGTQGLIYIDIDVTKIPDDEVYPFMSLLRQILMLCFDEETNTRVSAIVLTGRKWLHVGRQNRIDRYHQGFATAVIMNPYSPFSGPIPAQALEPDWTEAF